MACGGVDSAWLQATTEYLPYLYAVLACIEADDLHLQTEPSACRSLTSSPALAHPPVGRLHLALDPFHSASKEVSASNHAPFLVRTSDQCAAEVSQLTRLDRRHYELSATLLTHALCLSNHASTLVASLGSYETSSSVTTAALKSHDGTVNSAAELLCCSSGVLTYLAETVIPRWEAAVGEGVKGRPVELTRDVVTALSKSVLPSSPRSQLTPRRLALADANLLAIRRLLSRSLASSHSNTTPGPPLSSSHPSPSLLAKLHLNVFNLYDSARSLCKTASRLSDASGEMHPDLRRYLSDGRTIALSLSYKWLGVDAGENGGREKAGEAVAWLGMAKASLEEMGGKGAGLKSRMGMGKVGGKERKGKVAQEVDSIGAFLSAYRKVNDTVRSIPPSLVASSSSACVAGPLPARASSSHSPASHPRRPSGSRTQTFPPSSTSLPSAAARWLNRRPSTSAARTRCVGAGSRR